MNFRQATPDDIYRLARLWAQSFPGERRVEDRAAQLGARIPYGGVETAWLLEERGRLAGAFRGFAMRQHLGGALIPMLGLASVATAPTARRRGVGRALCVHALRVGRERGDLVSVLYPFRPSFYRRLGWGVAGELESHHFSPSALPAYDEAAGVRAAEEDDYGSIMHCYSRVAARSNGLIERDGGIWAFHLSQERVFPFLYEANGVSGYILARFAPGSAPGEGLLSVVELVAEDDVAYRGLLGWLALQRDQVREVRYDARPDERFEFRLEDPRPPGFRPARRLWYPTAHRIRGPMLRIIDLPGLFEARTRWGMVEGEAFTSRLEVEDAELPENSGPWTLTLADGRMRVRRGGDGGMVEAVLGTDMATLAEIFVGTLSPSVAVELGLARGEGAVGALDRIFAPHRSFWLLDEF